MIMIMWFLYFLRKIPLLRKIKLKQTLQPHLYQFLAFFPFDTPRINRFHSTLASDCTEKDRSSSLAARKTENWGSQLFKCKCFFFLGSCNGDIDFTQFRIVVKWRCDIYVTYHCKLSYLRVSTISWTQICSEKEKKRKKRKADLEVNFVLENFSNSNKVFRYKLK